MIRWREALILALLVLSPIMTGSEEDDDDTDTDGESADEDEGDEEGEPAMKELPNRRGLGGIPVSGVNVARTGSGGSDASEGGGNSGRRQPPHAITQASSPATRTMRRPLECYVCSYKSDSFLRSCLDPTKFRVHTMACHNVEDKCFTAVTSRDSSYEAVMRGCRSGCVATPETSCCATDRCNNQAMAMPVIAPKALVESAPKNKADKPIPPTVLFFISVLLVLQTVVKVAVV